MGWVRDIEQDLRYAIRTLRRSPGFAAVAILTLALGIGANTAIFSVCDALLLRALPYPDSDRLVALRSSHSSPTPDTGLASPLDLADWQARATSFDAIAGYRWRTVDLTGGAYSERLYGLWATPEFFNVFGVTRVNGRTFTPRDRGTNTIVLSRGVWERRFAADRALIGSPLNLNMINLSRAGATPHLVLGVVPVDVHFPPLTADFNHGAVNSMAVSGVESQIDFWLPLFLSEDPKRDDRTLDVVAKMRPGVTLAHAQAEMDVVAHALADAFPATNRNWSVQVVPLRSHILGATRRVVLLLLLASMLVLVIACGNMSTLLIASCVARQSEVAVRFALGASRYRIARHFLIESLLLAVAAAAVGVGIVALGIRLLTPWFPADVPLIHRAGINGSVLSFAIALAIATACCTGIVPAWGMSNGRLSAADLNVRGQSAGRRHHRAISTLVAAQVALTIVLLVSTGLLFKSAAHLLRVEPGFTPRNILTMTISLPNNKFDWQHNVVFSRDVVNAVKTNPVVTDAAVIQGVPMRPGGFWTTFTVEGMPPPADPGDLPVARHRVISPDYFRVMQIPLLEGRNFDERDGVGERGHPKFVIVNHALAARYWPGQSAVGKRMHAGPDEWVTVAGVVGDVRYSGLDTPPEFEIYLPEALFPQSAITLLVKTTMNPLRVVGDIRSRIARIDREAFVTDVRTMDELIADSLAPRWFATLLLAVCGGLGLLLSLSGIYGIVAQAVVQRRFEIGIRLALGSTPKRVVRLMLQRSVSPVATGAIVGLVGMVATAHLLSAMLFETAPFDPATFIAATGLFFLVALIAAFLPARRATKVDPIVALRCE
jgi:putative ABC transport system permease protein